MNLEAEQLTWELVLREAESSLVKCDCVSLEQLAAICGTLIDETFIADPEEQSEEKQLQSGQEQTVGRLQSLGELLENTRRTLKMLSQSGPMRREQLEYIPSVSRGK